MHINRSALTGALFKIHPGGTPQVWRNSTVKIIWFKSCCLFTVEKFSCQFSPFLMQMCSRWYNWQIDHIISKSSLKLIVAKELNHLFMLMQASMWNISRLSKQYSLFLLSFCLHCHDLFSLLFTYYLASLSLPRYNFQSALALPYSLIYRYRYLSSKSHVLGPANRLQ